MYDFKHSHQGISGWTMHTLVNDRLQMTTMHLSVWWTPHVAIDWLSGSLDSEY